MQYSLVGTDDGSNITVFIEGQTPLVAHSSHPNFQKIVDAVTGKADSDVDVPGLFDLGKAASAKFERLTERVTVDNGHLYLDGDEVDNSLASQVLRFLEEGVEDWKPLINFFENVQANPLQHSRDQLYDWLKDRPFTITKDGLIVGYKGVQSKNGEYFSINSGTASVDGVVHTGQIPNKIGSVVEMPRTSVVHDPADGCNRGLHVGTYDFAKHYASGALLEVHVNPRDVVSVPTDCSWQKMRVCRYRVIGITDVPYMAAVIDDWADEDDCHCGGDCDDSCVDLGNSVYDLEPDSFVEEPVESEPVQSPVNSPSVAVGDRFADLDKRRDRVIEVTTVHPDNTVTYKQVDGAGTGSIKLKRLLTPYRFRKES